MPIETKIARRILNKSLKRVVKNARKNLNSARGKLHSTMAYYTLEHPEEIEGVIVMEHYGKYQDLGVSGTQRKFNTPFSYTTKKPPASAFANWSVMVGIAPRTEKGQFTNRMSLMFALATWIYQMGITPKLFMTKAFEAEMKILPDLIAEATGLDIDNMINININDTL